MSDSKKPLEPLCIKAKKGESLAFCMCGKSQKAPRCDGSHKDSPPAKPLVYTAKEDEDLFLCVCRGSSNRPWCDGTHSTCPEHGDFMNRW